MPAELDCPEANRVWKELAHCANAVGKRYFSNCIMYSFLSMTLGLFGRYLAFRRVQRASFMSQIAGLLN
jgi:hypothetical protein